MKRLAFALTALWMLTATCAVAQDDVYFVPKKKKANTTSVQNTTYLPQQVQEADAYEEASLDGEDWYVGREQGVDVDAYNRRYADTTALAEIENEQAVLHEGYDYGDGYDYDVEPACTERLLRFHGYYDPWYYSSLAWNSYYMEPFDWYYDPWYYGSWGRHGWHYSYGWGYPYYSSWYGPYWNNWAWGYHSPWYGGWGWNHHHWYGGWNHHNNWAHSNSDGSRGPQNRGGYREGTRSGSMTSHTNHTNGYNRSTMGRSGQTGSRIGAAGINNPGNDRSRSSLHSTTRSSAESMGSRVGQSMNSGSNASNRRSNVTVNSSTPSRSSSSSSHSSSSYSSPARSNSSSSTYSTPSRSSGSSFGSGGNFGGSRSSGGSFGGGGSRGGSRR